MASTEDDSGQDFDGPWSEETGGAKKALKALKHRKLQSKPLDPEIEQVGEDWGIPGLEIVEKLRPSGPPPQTEEQLAEARKKVVSGILNEVLNRAESLRARVWDEYQKAVKEGRRKGPAEKTLKAVQTLARARRLHEKLGAELELQLREAAAKIEEEHIVGDANRKPEGLWPIVGEALKKGLKALTIVVRIHPRDIRRIEDDDLDLLRMLEHTSDIDLREDEWVKPGTCVIETEAGVIEAHPDTQPEQLGHLLLGQD